MISRVIEMVFTRVAPTVRWIVTENFSVVITNMKFEG